MWIEKEDGSLVFTQDSMDTRGNNGIPPAVLETRTGERLFCGTKEECEAAFRHLKNGIESGKTLVRLTSEGMAPPDRRFPGDMGPHKGYPPASLDFP